MESEIKISGGFVVVRVSQVDLTNPFEITQFCNFINAIDLIEEQLEGVVVLGMDEITDYLKQLTVSVKTIAEHPKWYHYLINVLQLEPARCSLTPLLIDAQPTNMFHTYDVELLNVFNYLIAVRPELTTHRKVVEKLDFEINDTHTYCAVFLHDNGRQFTFAKLKGSTIKKCFDIHERKKLVLRRQQ
jgi:hypothetical protein